MKKLHQVDPEAEEQFLKEVCFQVIIGYPLCQSTILKL